MTEPSPPAHPTTTPLPPRTDDRHLPPSWVADYAAGRLAPDLLGHAESHLRQCRRCADSVGEAVRQGPHQARLDAIHTALLTRIGEPPPPPEPAAGRAGPPPWLGVTQGLRLRWLLAVAGVCALGVALAKLDGSPQPRLLLLLVAPLLPMLCVAGSYGGKADPFAEVTRTTPAGGLRILLMRTSQVLVVCVPLLTGAAVLMPREGRSPYTSAGWLLPCLALTLATLLLSSYVGSWTACLTTGLGWLLTVSLLAKLAKPFAQHTGGSLTHRMILAVADVQETLVEGSAMLALGVASAVLAQLLVMRRHSFSRPGAR